MTIKFSGNGSLKTAVAETIFACGQQGLQNRQTASIRIYPDKTIFSNYGGLPQGYSVEDFIKGRKASYTRNKFIARVFKDASIIEEYSSGLKRVTKAFMENGNEPLEFHVDSSSFTIFAKSINDETLQKTAEKSSEKILVLLAANAEIGAKEISEKLNISQRAVEKQIAKLEQKGLLRRVGPDKGGGHWEITNGKSA